MTIVDKYNNIKSNKSTFCKKWKLILGNPLHSQKHSVNCPTKKWLGAKTPSHFSNEYDGILQLLFLK